MHNLMGVNGYVVTRSVSVARHDIELFRIPEEVRK
jgi:hypothetical protein